MLSFIRTSFAVMVVGLILVPAVFAQPASTTNKSNGDAVTERQFTSKIFELKYRDPVSVASILRQLGSGYKGAGIDTNAEFKTITVRDFPENIATMEAAIQRLDVPAPPRASIELHMHVLVASSRAAAGGGPDVPAELRDVLTQLRGTLTYRNYELFTSVVQRLTETPRGLTGTGTAQIPGVQANTPAQFEYLIGGVSLVPGQSGAPTIQIQEFTFTVTGEGIRGRVHTALNLKDGEKVVVGTATINDRALIVVLIPRIVN